MKKIKIKFVGFWEGFNPNNNYIYKILKKNYEVEISNQPEYIICSIFGEPYEYCKYPQVRIMYVGENYIPDFNYVDYAVSRYPLNFQDRHLYMPGCIDVFGRCEELQMKKRDYTKKDIFEKKYFANFIYSHESEYGIRGDFFKKLSNYKRVESPGSYLNNMEIDEVVNWENSSKVDFQRKCKFTLAFESTLHEGFVTEKITDAFYADTIPIYYGSSTVKEIFNEKAFICCSDYDDFEQVIDKIIELDQDDDKYLQMLREPILNDSYYATKKVADLEEFLCNIIEQPIDKAFRRSRVYWPKRHENYINEMKSDYKEKKLMKKMFKRIKSVIWR